MMRKPNSKIVLLFIQNNSSGYQIGKVILSFIMIQVNLRSGPVDLCHVGVILSQERLAVYNKQSFLNLLRQNGRCVTKVYSSNSCAFSLTLLHSCQNFFHHMTKKRAWAHVTYYHDISFGYSILKEMVKMITKFKSIRKKSEMLNAGHGLMQYYPLP